MSAAGAIIMSGFAAVWWLVAFIATGQATVATYAIPVVITSMIVAVALRAGAAAPPVPAAERARRGRLVGIASAVEGVAILIAVNVLANVGGRDFTAPVIAMIVGLHFVPLARALPARLYYLTAAFLVGLGVAGCFVTELQARVLGVGVGAACVLWLTSAAVLRPPTAGRASP